MQSRPPIRFELRRAVPPDAPCLGVLATQVFLDTYATGGIRPAIAHEVLAAFSTPAMSALLEREATRIEVAECEGHLIGFAQLTRGTVHELVDASAPAELDTLYVQEPFTHLGVGSALLRQAEVLAAAQGASDLWLTPWIHNHRALTFYRKHAYVDLGATWFRMEGETHENRVLSKRLARATP